MQVLRENIAQEKKTARHVANGISRFQRNTAETQTQSAKSEICEFCCGFVSDISFAFTSIIRKHAEGRLRVD